jgi:hypothetical protein
VVGEYELATELRKRPDMVGAALNLLLGERKVRKAPVSGVMEAERVDASGLVLPR